MRFDTRVSTKLSDRVRFCGRCTLWLKVAVWLSLLFLPVFFGFGAVHSLYAAEPDILYVAPGGSDTHDCSRFDPCLTLQGAVDKAVAGDEIRVAAGVYTGSGPDAVVTIDKSLTLRGGFTTANWLAPDPQTNLTAIDGGLARRCIHVSAGAQVLIEGFHIRYGLTQGEDLEDRGAGIRAYNAHVTLRRNWIYDNETDATDLNNAGGGVASDGTTAYLHLVDNRIYQNNAYGGSGVLVAGGSTALIERNTISDNVAAQYGAFMILGTDTVSSDAIFRNNLVYRNDGGSYGGGVFIGSNGILSLEHTTFYSNVVAESGSALAMYNGVVTGTNTLFVGNTAASGGAIYLFDNSPFTLTASDFQDNVPAHTQADLDGWGSGNNLRDPQFVDAANDDFRLASGSPAIDDGVPLYDVIDDVEGHGRPFGAGWDRGAYEAIPDDATCYARIAAGRVYTDVQAAVSAAPAGGLVKVAGLCQGVTTIGSNAQTVLITKSLTLRGGYTVTDWSTAAYGPTILDAQGLGRGIHVAASGADVTVENLHITGGAADFGAGIYVPDYTVTFNLANSVLYGNVAGQWGGGLYSHGQTDVQFTVFYTNTAAYGGAIYAGGTRRDLVVRNSVFMENDATLGGGALYRASGVQILGDYNDFYANTPDAYGNVTPGGHDLAVNPAFVNAAGGDFHLAFASPLVNAADPAATLAYDFEADPRPTGDRADIGVDELPIFAAVTITPPSYQEYQQDLGALRGETFTFTHTIENTGYTASLSDTYEFEIVNGDGWTVTPQQMSDVALDDGETYEFEVAVTVPSTVTAGFYNETVITVTSKSSAGAYDVAVDAIANPGLIFTPNYTQTADPGDVMTLTHTLTNIGPADSYTLTLASDKGWGEILTPEETVITLGPNESVEVLVRIAVPSNAAKDLVDTTVVTATSHVFDFSANVTDRTTSKATSGTRYVIPGGDDEVNNCTLQEEPCGSVSHAVDQAVEGDEILLAEGRYTSGEIVLSKYVDLLAGYRYAGDIFVEIEEGPDPTETVIDFQGSHRGIRVILTGLAPLLEGFTITNTRASDGGALLLVGAAGVQLQDMFIYDAHATASGGALYVTDGSADLRNVEIAGANADVGGAIYNEAGTVTADGLIVHHNKALVGAGGALYNGAGGTLTLYNTFIYSNTAATGGGGVYNAGLLTAWNNTLVGNQAGTFGGGLYDYDSAGLTVRNTIFAGNSASAGGGLYQAGVPLTSADYNLFWDNQAASYSQRNLTAGPHDLELDPLFVAPGAGDFHLTFKSPCVDTADPNTGLVEDFEGDIRPSNHGYDIGADELRGCLARVVHPGTGEQVGDIFDGVQQAVDFADPGYIVQLSGICLGVKPVLLDGEIVSQTVIITKDLTLRGGYPATFDTDSVEPTYLNALDKGRVVVVSNPTTVTMSVFLSRMTIEGGMTLPGEHGGGIYNTGGVALRLDEVKVHDNHTGLGGYGGGLYSQSGALLGLADTEFVSNTAAYGGGIYNAGWAMTISPTLFLSNAATQGGGGLYNASGASLTLDAATVLSNTAHQGGGLYNAAGGDLELTNSLVVSNTTTGNGGGLYNLSPDLIVRHDTFYANMAQNGGAIYHDAMAGAVINSTLLVSNTATSIGGGGGLYNANVAPAFDYNGLYGNAPNHYSAGFTPGTGIVLDDPNFLSFSPDAATFLHIPGGSPAEDQADPASPLLLDIDGAPRPSNQGFDIGADEVGDCYVRINGQLPTYGNVQRAIDAASPGDVLYIAGTCRGVNPATVGVDTVYQTAFVDYSLGFQGGYTVTNWAEPDPAVYTTTLDAAGGGRVAYITGPSSVVTMTGLHLIGGHAENGGGVFVAGGVVTLTQNQLYSHTASMNGGALYHSGGQLVLDGNRLFGNTATQGGGAIFQAGGAMRLVNTFLYRNTAAQGGGIYNGSTASFDIHHNTFYDNQATQGGGLYTENHVPSVRSNIFADNGGQGHAIYSAAAGDFDTPDYNGIYPPSSALGGAVLGVHSFYDLPDFKDAEAGNLRLNDTSPMIDQGDPAMALFHDFEGDLRPGDQGFDVGADERRSCWARVLHEAEILGPFGSPQLAIAASMPGDTIQVTVGECRGVHAYDDGGVTFYQTVHTPHNLTVEGGYKRDFSARFQSWRGYVNDDEHTIFNPMGHGRALLAHTGSVTVTRISMVNGNATLGGGDTDGGGFYLMGDGAWLSQVGIYESAADNGGGLSLLDGADQTLLLSTIAVYSNTATSGGGLFVPSGIVTLTGNTQFGANVASDGGALYNNGGVLYVGQGVELLDNEATRNGGGIYHRKRSGAQLVLAGSHLYANLAQRGGGLYAEEDSDLLVDMGTRFYLNTGEQVGGAIYGGGDNFTVQNTLIYTNTAQTGGGIYLIGKLSPRVEHNTIVANRGVQQGGGLYIENAGGNPAVRNNIFQDNRSDNGSAIYATTGDLGYNDYWPGAGSEQVAGGVDLGDGNLKVDPTYAKPLSLDNPDILGEVDFHLDANSPLLDVGLFVVVKHDMDDHPRPVNDAPDIGADEYPECLARVTSTGDVYGKIQDAIDNAGEGDTVQVAEGICYETVSVNKDLTLSGSWKKDFSGQELRYITSDVDAEENGRILTLLDNIVVDVSRIAFYNGQAVDGAGIYVGANVNATLSMLDVFSSVATRHGGGIYVASGALLSGTGLGVVANEAGENGGGIHNAGGATLSVCGSSISYNTAGNSGGGIYSASSADFIKLNNSSLRGNSAENANGGGLFNASPALPLTNVGFGFNMAAGRGGAVYNSGSNVSFKHNTVVWNIAGDGGDGIYNAASGVTFYAGIVSENDGPDGDGIYSGPSLDLRYTLRWQNDYDGSINAGEGNLDNIDPKLTGLYPDTDSPAIDQVPIFADRPDLTLDYDHMANPRPQICLNDMGYHEYTVGKRLITWTVPSGVTVKPGQVHTYTIPLMNLSEEWIEYGNNKSSMGPGTGYTETIKLSWISSRNWAEVVDVLGATNIVTSPAENAIIFDVGPGDIAYAQLRVTVPPGQFASVEDDPSTMETTQLNYETVDCRTEKLTGSLAPIVTKVALDATCQLAPERAGTARPGESVTYTHTITNVGNLTTTYTLASAPGFYAVAEVVSPTRLITQPLATVDLAPGMSATVQMRVTIRPEIAAGLTNVSTLIGTAGGARQCTVADATSTLETTGIRYVALSGQDSTVDETEGGNLIDLPDNNCTQPQVAPCQTLAHAMSQAQSGEEIRVAAGVYTETYAAGGYTQTLYIDKPITLGGGYLESDWGASPPNHISHTTVLDAAAAGRVVMVDTTGDVRLERMTLMGGEATGFGGGPSGADAGGILYNSGANLTLNALRMSGGYGETGGALYSVGGDLMLTNNLIYDNGFGSSMNTVDGGGLYLDGGSAYLLNNTLYRNHAGSDGAAVYLAQGSLTLTNNLIAEQTSGAEGEHGNHTAVHVAGGTASVDYNLWYLNGLNGLGHISGHTLGANAVQDEDPLVVNSFTIPPDLRLQSESPAREAGDPATDLGLFPLELDHNNLPRRMGLRVDIGAHERVVEASFELTPAYRYEVHNVGDLLTYVHTLTNTGEFTDTYDLTWSSSLGWIDTVTYPTPLVLAPGASTTITLEGDVPSDSGGLMDVATITVTTGLGTGAYKTAVDETRASFTPGVTITPPAQSAFVDPGDAATYHFTVTNTSVDGYDSFTLTATTLPGWTVVAEPGLTPLLAPDGATAAMTLTVMPPADAISGTTGVVTVTATSSFDGATSASATATTTVNRVRDLVIAADDSQSVGGAATTVTYHHTLTNTGNITESITLTYTSSLGWIADLFEPASPVLLGPGESVPVTLRLAIPPDSGDDVDTTTITAQISGTSITDTVQDVTTVGVGYGVTLVPTVQTSDAAPGDTVVFTHTLTNTGNAADSYALSITGDPGGWVSYAPSSASLDPGADATVFVTVTIPTDAGAGPVALTLTAQSQQDSTVSASAVDTVNVVVEEAPITGLQAFNDSPTLVGTATALWATVTGGTNVSYTWSFGDGSGNGDTGASVTYTYPSVGTYTAVVTASNALNERVATTVVTITDICVPVSITGLTSNSPVTLGETMSFTPTVTGSGPYTYTWDFGGAGTQDGTGANPTYSYDAAGTYTVTLTVENPCGTDSDSIQVTVDPESGPEPIIGLQALNDSPTPLGAVTTLSATVTSGEVLTFTWDFDDGEGATGNPVVHSYLAAGTYTATVTATNAISTVAATTVVSIVPRGVEVAPDNQAWAAAGDTVTYTHWVTNTGQFPDVFTMTTASSQGWSVGVTPAQLPLAGGESAAVTVQVMVPASPSGDQDVTTVTATSQGDPATSDSAEDTTLLLVESGAQLAPDRAGAVDPGTGIVYTHTLTNTGGTALTFDLDYQQDQGWLINVDPPTVTLDGGLSHPVTVTVTAPAGALAGTVNRVYVQATAQEDAAVRAYATDLTTVNQVFGVDLQPDRQVQGMPGEVLTLTHTLTNQGNGEDVFDIDVVSPSGWTVGAAPNPVTLAAGASRTITVTLTIPAGAAIGTQEQIAVSATSPGGVDAVASDDVEVVDAPEWHIYLPLIARNYQAPDLDAPNLVVTGISLVPANPQAGDPVTVRVIVENQGLQPVAFGNNFYVDFYVNRQPQPLLAGDLSWGAQGTWFAAGTSYTFEGTYTFTQGGDHTLYAQVDTDDTVVEGNEYDNVRGPQVVTVAGMVQQQAPDRPVETPAPLQGPRPTPTPQRAP